MRRDLVLIASTLLLFVVQGVLLAHPVVRTDLATLVVVYLTLERAVIRGAVLSLVIGYLNDVFAGTSHGLCASTMVVVFFLVRLLVAQMVGEGFLFVTAVSVFSTGLAVFAGLLIERAMGPGMSSLAAMSPALPSLLLSAAVLGYPIWRLFKALDERFTEPEDDFAHSD
jgi:rod shape-determining protein MreD